MQDAKVSGSLIHVARNQKAAQDPESMQSTNVTRQRNKSSTSRAKGVGGSTALLLFSTRLELFGCCGTFC